MFVINLHNCSISDCVLVHSKLSEVDMQSKCHINYISSIDSLDILGSINFDSVVIDLSGLTMENDMNDIIMEIIESQCVPIVKLPKNEEVSAELLELIDIYGLEYLDYNKLTLKTEPKLDSMLDYIIMSEVLHGVTHTDKLFTPLDYVVNIDIKDGKLSTGDELSTFNPLTLYKMLSDVDFHKLTNVDTLFSRYLMTPLPFVLGASIETVDNYKQEVFKKMVTLTARDIVNMPDEVRDMLIRANYIPLENIKQVEMEVGMR